MLQRMATETREALQPGAGLTSSEKEQENLTKGSKKRRKSKGLGIKNAHNSRV